MTYSVLECLSSGEPGSGLTGKIQGLAENIFYQPIVKLFANTLLAPVFYIAIAFTLLMEQFFPADPKQKFFNVNLTQDLVWFFYETILQALVITTYIYLVTAVYNRYLNFLTIEAAAQWPFWLRFAWGVLLLDFLYWLQHYLNHKVPVFWQFHVVHHSQRSISFFTDYRYHVIEYVVRHTILVIPFLIFKVNVPEIVAFSIFRRWYTRFYHGNIRMNMGFLRYILVTPQSHRVHHSILPEHRDKNFGAIFSIWDYLFGTQHRSYDEYPATGIEDDHFPHEEKVGLGPLLMTPLKQMGYSFREAGQKIKEIWTHKR